MVSKNKQKLKARKRQRSNSKSGEESEATHVTVKQKKKVVEEREVIKKDAHLINFYGNDESTSLLPTREVLSTQLEAAIRHRKFAIVEGPLGCGKTFLVANAAKSLRLPLNVMQMGDQIDSKTLFGTYHCTEVAGQFLWKPSKFAEWLSAPGVILLEDIDASNADVVSKIVAIAEKRETGEDEVDLKSFHPDVRIVATMSGKGKKNAVLDGVPVRVKLLALSDDELKRLAAKSYPRIAHLTRTLINIFRSVENVPGSGNTRQLTSTDFLRGCSRLSQLTDLSSNVKVFAELVDVWCLADLRTRSHELCKKIAAVLSITEDQVHFHLSVRQPEVSHNETNVNIGRAMLKRNVKIVRSGRHRLGHTRDVVQLMERIAVSVQARESVLLVGETGVGKTSVVQAVADLIGATLTVVNLSPTSDSDELIQGYKPTTIGRIMEPFTKFYMEVFGSHFDLSKNSKFVDNIEKCLSTGRFRDYLTVVESTATKALNNKSTNKDDRWAELLVRSRRIRDGLDKGAAPFALQKGAVLEAAERGHWLLVDEINLAPPECLDAIVHALSASETHPEFRLFACMNPATDAGKRRLPTGVRTRFTEIYVSETSDPHQLSLIVSAYLPSMRSQQVDNLVNFYLQAKQQYPSSYSLRTLCRALLFTADNMFGSEERSLFEAVCMAFLTNLDVEEKATMRNKIGSTFRVAAGSAPQPAPSNADNFVNVQGYWIQRGTCLPQEDAKFVTTKTVKANLAEIARIVCSGRFPILLEGETSAGKTSIVCHLARKTGNEIVRINNHEHTDVQEYMGSYVADSGGRLVFREGALVKAVREGSWVILDELNLAPTDVIEALNRLLDDNRELFVPELNETIRAHPRFRLFATQNPAGTYAGRKKLSRALLSRFIVLRFHHLPMDELSEMVCTRCGVPPSAASKMIAVLSELRNRRSLSGLFSARDGLMTLRDVFRWAKRLATDETNDDWLQVLVNHGYFLLAGRCRNTKDEETVVDALQKVIKRNIVKDELFALDSPYMSEDVRQANVVMTAGMRRMLVLTRQAWLRNEAVLMVGETGGGKTTLAEVVGQGKLRSINCHERTETADLLGRLRPKADGGFEWSDGVVISAMRDGVPLLVDEISLAEDSVLERLNPLFEEDRVLLLADAGVETQVVQSSEGFQMIATMNPGGDYGKKELSKALRNRFTEVWTSSDYSREELLSIFDARLARCDATKDEAKIRPTQTSQAIVGWIAEFFEKYSHVFRHAPSVRDIVSCAELYSSAVSAGIDRSIASRDAVCATFLDSLSGLTTRLAIDAEAVFKEAIDILVAYLEKVNLVANAEAEKLLKFTDESLNVVRQEADALRIGHLKISFGPNTPTVPKAFSLQAPTCVENFYRIARGLLINKPILLEGAPGCGKSSTVMALAQLTGNPITRLNLSDQTDLSDLFGSDVPVLAEDGSITFRWEDGPVLKAIKKGEWILLDEMNLASQSVLEGLNACFDHRRVLYIAELNRSFEIPSTSNCRFFACQNPRAQGGNRRALPKSFLNRFTNIYTNELTHEDIEMILRGVDDSQKLTEEERRNMVAINEECAQAADRATFAGGPHSFNLRDLLRWFELAIETGSIGEAFEVVYTSRMRKEEDRLELHAIYTRHMNSAPIYPPVLLTIDENSLRLGKVEIQRTKYSPADCVPKPSTRLVPSQMKPLHTLATCVHKNWLALLVGPRNCGKRAMIENLAALSGRKLRVVSLNADTDAQELIGSYEQIVDEELVRVVRDAIVKELSNAQGVSGSDMERIREANDLLKLEAAVEIVLSKLNDKDVVDACRDQLAQAGGNAMRFEWKDSPFVKTYLSGDWILIEDVNLCSAAVLDRLNSCLESGGRLVVSERQNSYEPLTPHTNFRVFLSMDSRAGEISRAMRNRSVEIFVDENERWYTNVSDISAVIGNDRVEILEDMAQKVSELSVEQQLHMQAMLNEFSFDQTCRYLGIEDDDRDVEMSDEIRLHAPKVLDIVDYNSIELENWLISNWKKAALSKRISPVESILLPMFAASKKMFDENILQNKFGQIGESFAKRLRPLLAQLTTQKHLIDSTFAGNASNHNQEFIQRYVNTTIFEWAEQIIARMVVEKGSAEHLSRTLTKYEMSTSEVAFANLPIIASAVDVVVKSWKDATLNGKSDEILSLTISLLLVVAATRRQLTLRTGAAAVYLAWNDVQNVMSKIGNRIEINKSLSKIVQSLNAGWSSDAHEKFLKDYLRRWRKYSIARPFDSANECERFVNRVEEVIAEAQKDGNTDVEMKEFDEEDVEKVEIPLSPIDASLRLVTSAQSLHAFLAASVVDESDAIFSSLRQLGGVQWVNDKATRFVQIALTMNATLTSKSDKEQKNESDVPVIDVGTLPSVGGGVHAFVARSFFASAGFDATLSRLSIAHLQKMADFKELRRRLWRLANDSQLITLNIKQELSSLARGLDGWSDEIDNEALGKDECIARIDVGLNIMKNAIPPPETLDPVVFEEQRSLFLKAKKRIVERQLELLAEWRMLVSRQTRECDAASSNLVIRRLCELREELRRIEEENDETQVDEQQRQVYRQSANQYTTLCAELRSFFEVAFSSASQSRRTATVQSAADEAANSAIRLAQLQSFLVSTNNFRLTLLRTHSSFIDVITPFIAGLLVVELATREVARKVADDERRRHLETTTAFPRFIKTRQSSLGLSSAEAVSWSVRDASPMPLRLKAATVRRRLLKYSAPTAEENSYADVEAEPSLDLQWTRLQWKKWYERNVAKAAEKDFVYRSKTEEEKDELDVEEFFSQETQDKEVLPANDVSLLLETMENGGESLVDCVDRAANDARHAMSLAWIRHVVSAVGKMPNDDIANVASVDGDETLFEWIARREGLCVGAEADDEAESTVVVDVYRGSSLRECRRLAKLLEKLAETTKMVQERWPEVVALKRILQEVDEFFAVSVSTPHVKLATQLEKLIEECEQWESMADRANSLREPLAPLRKMLVEWKKMEVRCWSTLLERAENEGKQRAQLVAYPLFEALFDAQTAESRSSLIPMCVEWMHNASLLDFSTRVKTVRSLAKWAESVANSTVSRQIASAAAHFEQFVPVVEKRLKEARDPAVHSLRDYVKIVKYNDLNLWNIKVSSQKAHTHLFKIIRRFKDAVGAQVDADFDVLLKLDEWKKLGEEKNDYLTKEIVASGSEEDIDFEKKTRKATKLAEQIEEKAILLCAPTLLEELADQTRGADESVRTMINYVGEDEEKEKQQGYARNSRQREVAMVLKQAQAIGFNARRAVALKTEQINEKSLIGVENGVCEKSVRICSSGRNTAIKRANKVDQQIGVATRKHLNGMIEYGMHYQLSLHNALSELQRFDERMDRSSKAIAAAASNAEDSWKATHTSLTSSVESIDIDLSTATHFVSAMKRRVDSVPDDRSDIDTSCIAHLHPLSRLISSDAETSKIRQTVDCVATLINDLKSANTTLGSGPVYLKSSYESWSAQMIIYCEMLFGVLEQTKVYFEVESRVIDEAVTRIKKLVEKSEGVNEADDSEELPLDVTPLLLVVQNLYKGVVESKQENEEKFIDTLSSVLSVVSSCGTDSCIQFVDACVLALSEGASTSTRRLSSVSQLCDVVRRLVAKLVSILNDALAQFCDLYHAVLSMTIQLFEKGYVNSIPKAEKQESGDGHTEEAGEGGGMGEGGTTEDARDVTDEMEETGQIEGLEDEQPADKEEQKSKNENEAPIDMDEDFAEDLQDIDKNEKGDQNEDGDEEDEEPEVEDQMGDVEDEDEKQLDPKLWDEEEEEEENQQKEMDQQNEGADDKRNEMVAKEDDPQANEDKEKEKDGENEQEADDKDEQEMENVDEREREDDGTEEDKVDEEARREDEIGDNEDEDTDKQDANMDEKMDEDGDATDEETKEGEGDEDIESGDEAEMAEEEESRQNEQDEAENEKKEDEAMEQGTGGERNENEKNDVGGANEEEEEEDKEDDEKNEEDQGEGKSKSDPRGVSGKGEEAKEKEENREEDEENAETEKEEKRKELAKNEADEVEEEAELGEGEENESGQQRENAPAAERQMLGAGSLEEAKETKREHEENRDKKKQRKLPEGKMDDMGADEGGEVEDENAEEIKQSAIHLAAQDMFTLAEEVTRELVLGDVEEEADARRQKQDEVVDDSLITKEADARWAKMSRNVQMLAAELAENLRLILEPQRATKMQGDYRSGKRLNMRRLIPYIASEYRKDRIWMRRTKMAQREYQILIAVDDSASMNESGIHEVTCESVCIVEDALRRCDCGGVSVCSFGSDVRTIIPFADSTPTNSIEMIKKLSFAQKSTDLLQLLRSAKRQLDEVRTPTSEQILIIISDGRGANAQGAEKVKAMYNALQGVTVLFVILDSGSKSINELSIATFKDGGVVLTPYLSLFPFPFYAVVKTIQQLPSVIAESIRQWFEMTAQLG